MLFTTVMKPKICPSCNLAYTTFNTRTNTYRNVSSKLPLLLRCGHTFCESCLSSIIVKKKGAQSQHISCPACKNSMLLQNGIKDLHANLYLLGQLEVGEKSRLELNLGDFVPDAEIQRKAKKKDAELFIRKCKLCEATNASCKCLECDSIMCSDCFERFHKVSAAIKQHQPVPLFAGRSETESASPNCKEHGRLIEYFCTEDNAAICSRCYIIGNHKNHSIISFEEKNKELLNDIEIETETAQRVIRFLDKSDDKLVSLVPDFKHEIKKIAENITESFLHIHTLLQVREMEITESLTQVFQNMTSSLEEKRESFCIDRANLEAAVKDAKMLIENNALVIDSADLLENLRAAKSMPCLVVQNSRNENGLSFQWEETCKEELVKAMQSFGSIFGNAFEDLDFLSVSNVPPGLEDQDNDDRTSVTSSITTSDRAKTNRISSTISSSDGVIIENSDADSDISRTSQRNQVPPLDSDKQLFQETLTLPTLKGRAQKVSVTHICSPTDFLVQLASNKRKLETLSHNINIWCKREASVKHIPNLVEVGSFVLAKYSVDKTWYRAKVLGLVEDGTGKQSSPKVHVQYIDYGNEEILSMKELRNMEKRFMLYPIFTVRCSLRDLAPYDEKMPWSSDTVAEFQKMTENQVFMLSTFAEQSKIYEVDLIYIPNEDVLDDGYVSVRDTLVFLELARFKTHSDAAKHLPTPSSYKLVDFIKPSAVKSGTTVDMIVTNVESPGKFHIVCQGDERVYYLNMLEEMQEMYGNDVHNIYSLYYPRLNVICCVLAKDGVWYRAKVVSLPKHRQVTVSLVDIGSTLVLGCDRIKKLHAKFVKLPAQAISCCLADVSPATEARGKWTTEAKHWFKDSLNRSSGIARVKRWGEPAELVLWQDSKVSPHQSINFLLVEMGFAISTGLSSVGATQDTFYEAGGYSSLKRVSREHSAAAKIGNKFGTDLTSLPDPGIPTASDSTSSIINTPKGSAKHKKLRSPAKKNVQPCDVEEKSPQEKPKRSIKKAKAQDQASQPPSQNGQNAVREKERVQKDIQRALSSDGTTSDDNSGSLYIEVIISSYESPSDFVLRVLDREDKLETLMRDMQVEYKDSSATPNANWKVGDFCAAKNTEEGLWYRGKIIVCDSDCLVEMVDFGSKRAIDYLDMRPLSRPLGEFMECAAVRCHIANLVPAGSGDPTKWSRTAIEFMKRETKDRKLYIKQEGDVIDQGLPIDIIVETEIPETAFDPAIKMYHSLRQAILDKGLAMPEKKVLHSSSTESDAFEPFQRVIFEKKSGLYDSAAEPASDFELPQTFHSHSTSVMETTPKSPEIEAGDCITTEEGPVESSEQALEEFHVLPTYPTLAVNESLEVFPTYVDSNGVIYVQPKEWEDMVIHLDLELQRVYSTVSSIPTKQWQVQQLCVAYYPTDDRWYRAIITEVNGDEIKVQYIDYGNTETVKQSFLREMLPEFGKIHCVALYCELHDIVPNTLDNKWPVPVLEYMHELMVNAWCQMNIIKMEDGDLAQVELIKTNGLDLGCHLVEQGMSSRISDMASEYDLSCRITQVLAAHNPFPALDVGGCGDAFQATLTHVELPNLIYVQRVRVPEPQELDFVKSGEIAKINSMIDEFEQMTQLLNACKSMPLSQLPDVGFMCVAKYSYDDVWYRGLVVDSYKSKHASLILYVDFGTSEVVPLDRLRQLPSEFWTLPAQAIRVYFNIAPPSGSKGLWKRDSLNAVVQALACKEIVVKITHSDPLTAELLTAGEDGKSYLAYDSVIEAGLALLPESIEILGTLDDEDVVVEGRVPGQTDDKNNSAKGREQESQLEDFGTSAKVDWWGADLGDGEGVNVTDKTVTSEETHRAPQTEGDEDSFSSGDDWTTDDEEDDKDSDATLIKKSLSPEAIIETTQE